MIFRKLTSLIQGLVGSSGNTQPASPNLSSKPSSGPKSLLSQDLALEKYWMGRDETFKGELTQEHVANAIDLLSRVQALLTELGVKSVRISSGWRPSLVNSKTPGAAKSSYHTRAKAVDLVDVEGKLYTIIALNPDLLKKHGLWMENRLSTKTWVHL